MSFLSSLSGLVKGVGDAVNPIMPLLNVGSSLVGTFSAKNAAESANQANINLQRESQDWQLLQANTAHQREVADLKAAGLNPILSAHGGAVVPSVPPARVESLAPIYQSSARDSRDAFLQTSNLIADLAVKKAQADANSAQAASINADAKKKELENKVIEAATPHKVETEKIRSERPKWFQWWYNQASDFGDWVTHPLRGIFNAGTKF